MFHSSTAVRIQTQVIILGIHIKYPKCAARVFETAFSYGVSSFVELWQDASVIGVTSITQAFVLNVCPLPFYGGARKHIALLVHDFGIFSP